jgi:hypothetical protein
MHFVIGLAHSLSKKQLPFDTHQQREVGNLGSVSLGRRDRASSTRTMNDRHRLSVSGLNRRAQVLMSSDNGIERPLERGEIKFSL